MCVSLGLKKLGDFVVSEGHGYPLVLYIKSLVYACVRLSVTVGRSDSLSMTIGQSVSLSLMGSPPERQAWDEHGIY